MAVTRPLKEGSVTTYQQKVAAGFPDILASEMDADLDTIYAAWNGGVATANLIDGAVTTVKLADGSVALGKIAVGAVRGTPSSGGTAREIVKASIWGGDDLIDLSLSGGKLAVGATIAAPLQVEVSGAPTATGTATALVSGTLPNFRGGWVLLVCEIMGIVTITAAGESHVTVNAGIDAAAFPTRLVQVVGTTNTVNFVTPWSINLCWLTNLAGPTANRTCFVNWQLASGSATFKANNGNLTVVGYA
jgi:hypothetical protein